MVQVQLRVPEEMISVIDKWVKQGRFSSRSEAIKAMIRAYEEKEKTREFLKMLNLRRKEMEKHPERMTPLEEL